MKLINPTASGYEEEVASIEEAKKIAATLWFDCTPSEIITNESGDGGTIYLYESQQDASADQDGAYSVQVQVHNVYEDEDEDEDEV